MGRSSIAPQIQRASLGAATMHTTFMGTLALALLPRVVSGPVLRPGAVARRVLTWPLWRRLGLAAVLMAVAMAGMAGAAMGAVAGGGAAANLVSCHACNARVPPGKFCAECGTTLAPQKKKCTGCGVDLQAGSKFCAECGTPANAPAAQ